MPKQIDFPKSLQQFPENAARELYIYRVVRRGLPHTFYKEFEDRKRAAREVQFRFVDVVMFFAQAAAAGVIGNFTYAAIHSAIKRIRRPKQELVSGRLRFEAVVSRKTYNHVRRKKNPGRRGRETPTPELEEQLVKEYRLMVKLFDEKKKLKSIHDQDDD
jgi:hypothetical protein